MSNNKGSAVAIVMMILGVVSLIGVALLSQSRIDTKFTTAVTSYDKASSLADGATSVALSWLENNSTEWFNHSQNKRLQIMPTPTQKLEDGVQPRYESACKDLAYASNVQCPGEWAAVLRFVPAVETDARLLAGYEAGDYFLQYFIAEGHAQRRAFGGLKAEVDVVALKITRRK